MRWWTISNWTFFVAFAPITGIFLAKLSYGRTVREFMAANWIAPSLFSIVWYGIWGGTAIKWQKDGAVDFLSSMRQNGSLSAIWRFVENLPLTWLLIPLVMFMMIISFATAADANIATIASLCVKDTQMKEEAPNWIKVAWGILSALISYLLIAFTRDQTGLAGIKALGSVGGLFMLIIVIFQLFSAVKLFFGKNCNTV